MGRKAMLAWIVVRTLAVKWAEDHVARLSAALAFYTALSLAPLLLIATVIAGTLLGRGTVRQEVVSRVEQLAGSDVAGAVEPILKNASLPEGGIAVSLVALAGFAFAASNVFFQLDRALNELWDIGSHPAAGLRATLKARLEALLAVMLVGVLLLVSPVLGLLTNYLNRLLDQAFPGIPALWSLLDLVITIGFFALLFGLVFKAVPHARIGWGTVAVGSLVTAVLFSLGVSGIAYYLETSVTSSLYGAAGSLLALLLWFYLASLILFLGAEMTELYARLRGERIRPYEGFTTASQERAGQRSKVDELVREFRRVANR